MYEVWNKCLKWLRKDINSLARYRYIIMSLLPLTSHPDKDSLILTQVQNTEHARSHPLTIYYAARRTLITALITLLTLHVESLLVREVIVETRIPRGIGYFSVHKQSYYPPLIYKKWHILYTLLLISAKNTRDNKSVVLTYCWSYQLNVRHGARVDGVHFYAAVARGVIFVWKALISRLETLYFIGVDHYVVSALLFRRR